MFVTPNSLDEAKQIHENVRKWVDFYSNSVHQKFTVEVYGKSYSAQKLVPWEIFTLISVLQELDRQ
jgi:hypothetical protein